MQIGETVPDFEATTDAGEQVRLSDYTADGPVVLFFYPKAETGGCTAEACHFRDLASEFEAAGARRVGVSRDSVDDQRAFSEKHSFGYPLLADSDGNIAKIFGAKRVGPMWHKRQTFVVGGDSTLLGMVKSESDMDKHADEALEILRRNN